jgi:aldose 1-epimerase
LLGIALRHRGRDYLDALGGSAAARGGHTAGLPLLAPWANRLSGPTYRVGTRTVPVVDASLHRDANGLPIHGTMIGRRGWEIVSLRTQTGSASMIARFDAGDDDEVMASFPFRHELVVGFTVTPGRLTVATSLFATGKRAVPVCFGWHPYFRLPEIARDRIRLGLPARHRLVLDDRGLPTGAETNEPAELARFADRELDDAYRLGRERQLMLVSGRRRLTVALDRNYRFAQVYAPAGSEFVALEPMTASTDALTRGETSMVEPGDRFTARFAISLT